jgi:hypothetical protein
MHEGERRIIGRALRLHFRCTMGLELHDLVREIREARAGLDQGDARVNGRIDQIEKSINELFNIRRSAVRDLAPSAMTMISRERTRPSFASSSTLWSFQQMTQYRRVCACVTVKAGRNRRQNREPVKGGL